MLEQGKLAQARRDDAAAHSCYLEALAIWRDLPNPELPWFLDALAGLAAAQGQAGRAARLYGAAAALHDALGWPLPPEERADHDRTVAAARAALGDEAFAAAWAEGRAMTRKQAFDYALGEAADV